MVDQLLRPGWVELGDLLGRDVTHPVRILGQRVHPDLTFVHAGRRSGRRETSPSTANACAAASMIALRHFGSGLIGFVVAVFAICL
jgi:hypothetical protein